MKSSFKFLAVLLPLLLLSNISSAKNPANLLTSLKHAGSSYRTVLLKNGWKPVMACPHNRQPEFYNCSASGLCNSFWKKGDNFLSVGTSGELTRKVYMAELTNPIQVHDEVKNTDQCSRLHDYSNM